MPKPFPSLFVGDLVRLAAPWHDDALAFSAWSHDSEYLRLVDTGIAMPSSPNEYAETMAQRRSMGANATFHIHTLAEDQLIGFAALHTIEVNNQSGLLSLGIGDPAFRGKGYGLDALRLLLNYGFNELNLYRVGLNVIAYNTAAVRLYEKAGFQREGVVRGNVYRDGRRYDSYFYGLLRAEWDQQD